VLLAELLLTLRDALERLSVAGVTDLTAVLLSDLDTVREGPPVVVLRDDTLFCALRLGAADVLRVAVLDAVALPVPERLTTRLGPEVFNATRSDERLRFLSQPPPLILRLGTKLDDLDSTMYVGPE
jgi:hypothetical protein